MPVNIYVSQGSPGDPPYKFYFDENGTQELTTLTLDPTQSYLFKRLNNTTNHPFYISDVGYKQSSSNKISLTGNGSKTNGIIGNQSLLLTFNEGSADLGQLYFYCTSHPSMISTFDIDTTQSGEISSNTNLLNFVQDTSNLDDIDWNALNSSKTAKKLYNSIDWATEFISSEVAAELDFSKVNFNKLNLDNLENINDLNFATLGKNYKKLKWDQIDYSALNDASKDAIDWTKVNLKKATKSENFDMGAVDWEEINTSKSAAKSYKAIDWANVSISSEVSAKLDYSKVNFKKLNLDNLENINDLNFSSLGKNYKKLKWNQIDYSELNPASIDAIDWGQVDFNKAIKSSTFDLDDVDWAELNSSKSVAKSYKAIDQNLLNTASIETLSLLNTSHLNKNLISSDLFFSETPQSIGNFENIAGTSQVDNITGVGGEAIFAGDGDDILISKKNVLTNPYNWTIPTFLTGGNGDDTYKVNKNSFALIYDVGNGVDLLDLNSMSSANTDSWILDDVQGIFISDGKTGALVIKGSEIEKVKFGGKTYIQPDAPNVDITYSSLSNLASEGILNEGGILDLYFDQTSLDSYINSAQFNNSILF